MQRRKRGNEGLKEDGANGARKEAELSKEWTKMKKRVDDTKEEAVDCDRGKEGEEK